MKTVKLSVNKACVAICAVLVLLSLFLLSVVYYLTQNTFALVCVLLYVASVIGCMAIFLTFIRRKLTLFSDACFIKSSTDFPVSMKCCGKAKAALQRNGPTCRN